MDQSHGDNSAKFALEFIQGTHRHVFLTGKAGSGKTTFLKSLKTLTNKKIAVAAPTGIAAVNASGVTLHSLFQLPTGVFLPGKTNLRVNIGAERKLLLRELELLVIDEVSMVRADLLDAIDKVLRDIRKNLQLPFGGIQVLYIGDLYQLSPVATGDELKQLLECYDSLYFTSSKVFRESNPVCIELDNIYRQKDPAFISILNNIRIGTASQGDIALLNSYCRSSSTNNTGYVTLVTHNQAAEAINQEKLTEIPGEGTQIPAEIVGEFDYSTYPTDSLLHVKVGSQVMILRNERGNGRKYFNGKMGILRGIEQEKLIIEAEENTFIEIQKETWKNIRYEFDEKTGRVMERELGSFTQFPIRLAWAVTVHKSQGLTFDRAVLDVQNVFAPGQAYVAFSRVRSLEGLMLAQPIYLDQINANASRPVFHLDRKEDLPQILLSEKIKFLESEVKKRLAWKSIEDIVVDSRAAISGSDLFNEVNRWIGKQKDICEKFDKELERILESNESGTFATLTNRIQAACTYLKTEVDNLMTQVLTPAFKKTKGSITQKLQHRFVSLVIDNLRAKNKDILQLELFAKGPNKPVSKAGQVRKESNNKLPSVTGIHELVLAKFNEGATVNDVANKLQLSIPTVENYLADFVRTGEIQIHQLVRSEILEEALVFMTAHNQTAPLSIKSKFGDRLSFGQIKAILYHFRQKIS